MKNYPLSNSIIDSIRFCIMFDIVVGSENKIKNSDSLVYRYIKETREKSDLSEEKIQIFIENAYKSLSSEFRSIYKIPQILNR